MGITSLVTKLLGPPANTGTSPRSPGHLRRWLIFGNQRLKVYLDHSSHEDLTAELRRYPDKFISIGLMHSYTNNSSGGLEIGGDQSGWMVLIAKSSEGPIKPHS